MVGLGQQLARGRMTIDEVKHAKNGFLLQPVMKRPASAAGEACRQEACGAEDDDMGDKGSTGESGQSEDDDNSDTGGTGDTDDTHDTTDSDMPALLEAPSRSSRTAHVYNRSMSAGHVYLSCRECLGFHSVRSSWNSTMWTKHVMHRVVDFDAQEKASRT